MRLLCPYCQKAITVPDSEAGKAVNCPECHQQFAAPQLYAPAPVAPPPAISPPASGPPVPPPVPETYVKEGSEPWPPPESVALPELPAPDREMSGFKRMVSLPLDPQVIRWIPAGALFLAFVLTFFSWNGLYPGGHSAYTQNAWQALFGVVSKDEVADDLLKMNDDLEKRAKSSLWLLPYLLLLFPAIVVAAAGPIVQLTKFKLPEGVEKVWQFRPLALGAIAILLLLFLLAQWASGLGLQNAINTKVEEEFPDKKAAQNTPEKMQKWEIQIGMAKGAFQIKTTPWFRLTILLHLLAAAAVAAEAGLMLRGKKPPPRVAAMW
jgi:hypothetical protein